mmetsp:Transcript_30449/g.35472  ORF Transcript_30449/g.35472 Transcript_30449/m.35472 type:complete len:322 (-) Transcript_30449:82-1047(-)
MMKHPYYLSFLLLVHTTSFSLAFQPVSKHHDVTVKPKSVVTMFSSALSVTNNQGIGSGEANGKIKEALKKMRGITVSISYKNNNPENDKEMSSMDMEILSQGIRRAKSVSIWTDDLDAMYEFAKEQESAKGSFPGPCPIIYNGDVSNIEMAIEKGASGVLVNSEYILNSSSSLGIDVICNVKSIEDIRNVLEVGYNYAFYLPGSLSDDDFANMLTVIPKESLVITSFEAMQKNSYEITRAKELVTLVSAESGTKVHTVVIQDACVGDEEDLKYTSFVVDSMTKKASSSFSMTGLTGSTNGHFGTMSDNASIEKAKWKRIAE